MGIIIDDLTPEQYALLQTLEPLDLIEACNGNGACDAGFIDFGRLPGGFGLFVGNTPILEWLEQWSNIYQVRRWVPDGNGGFARTTVWDKGGPVSEWTHQAQGGYVEESAPWWSGFVNTGVSAAAGKYGTIVDLFGNLLGLTSDPNLPGTMYFRFTYIDETNGTGYIREIVVNPASKSTKSMIVDQSWIPIPYNEHAAGPPFVNDLSWLNAWTNRYYEK